MRKLWVLLLVLFEQIIYAICDAQIIFQQVNTSGTATEIVRQTPIIGAYTLVKATTSVFPDLHDRFLLGKAQRVGIFYTITSWTPDQCSLQTMVRIDGKQNPAFNYVSFGYYERTHTMRYSVWLEAGNHTV